MAPEPNSDAYWTFHYAIIVSYGRPYSDNDLGSLKGKRWNRFGEPRLDTTHQTLLNLRRKLVAHSDSEARPVWIYTPGTRLPNGTVSESYGVICQNVAMTNTSYLAVRELCSILHDRLSETINIEVPRLFPDQAEEPFRLTWGDSE